MEVWFSFLTSASVGVCPGAKETMFLEGFEPRVEALDQIVVVGARRQRSEPGAQEGDDGGLAQEPGLGLGVICGDPAADGFGAANPASQGDQGGQFLVVLFVHGDLDLVLGGFEFLLKGVPFVIFGKILDAFAAAQDVFAYAEGPGDGRDVLADVLDLLAILRLDGYVTVGDEAAEIEGDLRAAGIGSLDGSPVLRLPVRFAHLVERGKQFAGRGDGKSIVGDGVREGVLGELGYGLVGRPGVQAGQCKHPCQ